MQTLTTTKKGLNGVINAIDKALNEWEFKVDRQYVDRMLDMVDTFPQEVFERWNELNKQQKADFKRLCIEGDAANENIYGGFLYSINPKNW